MRRFGDRKDAKLLKKIDSMHTIMPLMYPNRCDNEAFISECIDVTNILAYLQKRNREKPEYRYSFFHVIVTAVLKTITLRPKMNYFIANKRMYERNEVSAAFTMKKVMADDGDEALCFIHAKDTDNLDSIHDEIYRQVSYTKLPGPILKFVGLLARALDRHGLMPKSVIATDPYYASALFANLGSIRLHAGYHHLTNWGTMSLFVIVGEVKKRPFYDSDGNVTMRSSIDIGLTVDERIADGYYYSKSIRLLKKLLQNPELLEKELKEEITY